MCHSIFLSLSISLLNSFSRISKTVTFPSTLPRPNPQPRFCRWSIIPLVSTKTKAKTIMVRLLQNKKNKEKGKGFQFQKRNNKERKRGFSVSKMKMTKGGKVMNPTDAYQKELQKKELKRILFTSLTCATPFSLSLLI